MKYLILLFLLRLPVCNQLDVMIVVDMSGSVEGKEVFIKEAIDAFVSRFDDVRIGIVTFSGEATLLSGLTSDKQLLHDISIGRASGATNMAAGLYVAGNELIEDGRQEAKKIVIMISDGGNNHGDDAKTAASSIKTFGIGICSVVVDTEDTNIDLMSEISSGCYQVAGYENLLTVLKNMNICL